MFKKIKEFFENKYRIVPVYADNKKVGFMVQKKYLWIYWDTMMMPKVEKIKCEKEEISEHEAFFTTEEEANAFITYQKTVL